MPSGLSNSTGLAGASFKGGTSGGPSCPKAARTSSSRFTPKHYMGGPAADRIMRSETIRRGGGGSLHGVCMSLGGLQPIERGSTSGNAFVGSSNVMSRRWSRNIWRGRCTRARISMTYCRCRIPRPLSSVSALTCSRCRTPSVGGSCSRIRRAISCFVSPTMSETDFLRELARHTGCGLLLWTSTTCSYRPRISVVSALDYLSDFLIEHVGEIHLAGHAEDRATKRATACSSTVMTARSPMRCGNSSRSSSSVAVQFRRLWSGTAIFPNGRYSKPRAPPPVLSWTATRYEADVVEKVRARR